MAIIAHTPQDLPSMAYTVGSSERGFPEANSVHRAQLDYIFHNMALPGPSETAYFELMPTAPTSPLGMLAEVAELALGDFDAATISPAHQPNETLTYRPDDAQEAATLSLLNNYEISFVVKWIRYHRMEIPILLQDANGPCALLALANILLLRRKLTIERIIKVSFKKQFPP